MLVHPPTELIYQVELYTSSRGHIVSRMVGPVDIRLVIQCHHTSSLLSFYQAWFKAKLLLKSRDEGQAYNEPTPHFSIKDTTSS
jgi:hypothetical protein